jgi:DNA-binding SARP family transcriptional activator
MDVSSCPIGTTTGWSWTGIDIGICESEALERAAAALLDQRRTGDALVAALAAIQSEPLRESAWRLLVQIHLAQANVAEAIRSYREYRALLQREFGIEPSTVMERLLEDCGASPVATDAPRAV